MKVYRCANCMGETEIYPCPHCGYDGSGDQKAEFALMPGQILGGKYLVGRMLGRGGFGITYVGFDLMLERKVAIKEYFPTGVASRQSSVSSSLSWFTGEQAELVRRSGLQTVLAEARKMAKLESISQVVSVKDAFEENSTAYIVMDFVEGESLKDHLLRSGPLSWQAAEKLFLPIINALDQVHQAGVVHRDISPDNLMILPDGTMKLLDLGAAKDISSGQNGPSAEVIKNGFSPFEQYTQRGSAGPWSDVYALAATMVYSLTGIALPSALDRVAGDTIDWDLLNRRNVPLEAQAALRRALAIQMKERTQSMVAFAAELREQRTIPKTKPKWLPIAAAAAVVISLTIAVGVLAGKDSSSKPNAVIESVAVGIEAPSSVTTPEDKPAQKPRARIEEQEIYNKNGVTITATALKYSDYDAQIWLDVKNTGNKHVQISTPDTASINGYACRLSTYIDLEANLECKGGIRITQSELEAYGINAITDITFQIQVKEKGSYEVLDTSDFITIKTDQYGEYSQAYDDSGTELNDDMGVKIFYKEILEQDSSQVIRLCAINNSNEPLLIAPKYLSINGFMFEKYATRGVAPGKILYLDLEIPKKDLEQCGISTISDVEMQMEFEDINYRSIATSNRISISTGKTGDCASFSPESSAVLYNSDGILIASLGYTEPKAENEDPQVLLYVENNSNQPIELSNQLVAVNGIKISAGIRNRDILPGKKSVSPISLYRHTLQENGITDISEVKATLKLWDFDYNTIAENLAFTVKVP